MFPTLISALRETLFMVGAASLISAAVGIPLGVFIASIESTNNSLGKGVYYVFHSIIQFVKHTPYLLIMLLCVPLSNWMIDHNVTYITSTIVPLSVVASLMLAQKVAAVLSKLAEQWSGTTRTMGISKSQTMRLILLPEALPEIMQASFHTSSLIVGFSTIAGALGAGGLGQLAIEKSINEAEPLYVILCIVILVAIQQLIHYTGTIVVQQTQSR